MIRCGNGDQHPTYKGKTSDFMIHCFFFAYPTKELEVIIIRIILIILVNKTLYEEFNYNYKFWWVKIHKSITRQKAQGFVYNSEM